MKISVSQRRINKANEPSHEIRIPEIEVQQYLVLSLDTLYRLVGGREDVANDFLTIAGSCYAIDQLVPRRSFPDHWTRHLEVELPVANVELWEANVSRLTKACCFLTGDEWEFKFTPQAARMFSPTFKRLHRRRLRPTAAVSLFSGGLDSFAGVVDELAVTNERLTVVGHYDLGVSTKSTQEYLVKRLREYYPKRISLVQARIGTVTRRQDAEGIYGLVSNVEKETSFRSRSIVFLALGLYVGMRMRSHSLLIPENGFIALNPPLTNSRLGSCSTRTAHPLFLELIQDLVDSLGFSIQISNPLNDFTKGEVLEHSHNSSVIKDLAASTISCAHPTRREPWIRRTVNHCGYCFPCLLRRSAMHRVGLDNGAEYGLDVCAGELALDDAIKASDLRALLTWVSNYASGSFDPVLTAQTMALPDAARQSAQHVLRAGGDEISKFFRDQAGSHILEWAGID